MPNSTPVGSRRKVANPMQRTAERAQSHAVYAISADGSRQQLDVRKIAFVIGKKQLLVELRTATAELPDRLNVLLQGRGPLIVGPGDGNSVCLAADGARAGERGQ